MPKLSGRLETAIMRYVIFCLGETFDLPSSDVDSGNPGQKRMLRKRSRTLDFRITCSGDESVKLGKEFQCSEQGDFSITSSEFDCRKLGKKMEEKIERE